LSQAVIVIEFDDMIPPVDERLPVWILGVCA
jgi:hypothetical protein